MIKELSDDEREKCKKRLFEFWHKNRQLLLNKVDSIFSDIPFKEQNDFSIRIDYNPLKDCHYIIIMMRIYDGSLMRDYHFPSLWIPKPKRFDFGAKIIDRFYNDINGLSVDGYLYDLKDFIKNTKETIIEKLKFDIPYEDIKYKQDTPLDETTEKAIKEI